MHAQADAAVLRQPPLGDVEARHDLDARDHRGSHALGRRFDVVQHAVDAIAHRQPILERLDVDVGGAHVERVGDEEADEADDRRFGGQVLQLLHVGVEREFVDARLDVADHLALRRLAGPVEPLQRGVELGRDRDHRPHRAPGDHLERADGVRVGRIGHRQRDFVVVLAHRQRMGVAQEARTHALLENREFGIARNVDQRQRQLDRQRFRDVALRDHAERHQQRAQLFAGFLLQPQRAFECGRIELAALDEDLA